MPELFFFSIFASFPRGAVFASLHFFSLSQFFGFSNYPGSPIICQIPEASDGEKLYFISFSLLWCGAMVMFLFAKVRQPSEE